jgi:hypothetical protein
MRQVTGLEIFYALLFMSARGDIDYGFYLFLS